MLLTHQIDQPLKMNGAPCSVQLVGRPQQDEELMEAAKVVAEDLQIEKNMVNGSGEYGSLPSI